MPAPTAEALKAALATMSPEAAFRAFGVTRQAIYFKRRGVHIHPDLVAVLAEHRAATTDRTSRNSQGKQGLRKLRLPAATVAYLDALARRQHRGRRSGVARALLREALLGPLPAPEDASGERVVLDLGPVWDALAARVGPGPQVIAGAVRAIFSESMEKEAAQKKIERAT